MRIPGRKPIPDNLITGAIDKLPSPLKARAADPVAWRNTLGHMTRQSLARVNPSGLRMHRLTQAILRDRLTPHRAAAARALVETILGASDPGSPQDPTTWPRWEADAPLVRAAQHTADTSLRKLAYLVIWYLYAQRR